MKSLFKGADLRRDELHESQAAFLNEDGDSCNSPLRRRSPGKCMLALLAQLVSWFTQHKPPARRYRVTPRHNAYAFRRALVRAAMRELKRDVAFASLTPMNPDNLLDRR